MNTGTLVWMVIFAASALCFFVVAAVVSVKGLGDLRELLRLTKRQEGVEAAARDRRCDVM
jgi:hypothetical protein